MIFSKNMNGDWCVKMCIRDRFLLSETEYLKEAGKDIEKATEDFLKKGTVSLGENDYEKVRDGLFAVTSLAEETGFIKGFQYAVMLMTECYTAK